MSKIECSILLLFISLFVLVHSQDTGPWMMLVAGNTGSSGPASHDGLFTSAKINPTNNNNIIKVEHEIWAGVFAEENNHVIRAVDYYGNVKTIAGSQGTAGFSDYGSGLFNRPMGIIPVQLNVDYSDFDGSTTAFVICDYANNALRYMDLQNTSQVVTLATFISHVRSVFQVMNEDSVGGYWYVLLEDDDGSQYINGFSSPDSAGSPFGLIILGQFGASAITVSNDPFNNDDHPADAVLLLTPTSLYTTDLYLQNSPSPVDGVSFSQATQFFMDANGDLYVADQGVGQIIVVPFDTTSTTTIAGVSSTYSLGADTTAISVDPTTNSLYHPISIGATTNTEQNSWYLIMTAYSIRVYWTTESVGNNLMSFVEYGSSSTITFRIAPDGFFTRFFTSVAFTYQINGGSTLTANLNITSAEVTVTGYTPGAIVTYYVSYSYYDSNVGLTSSNGPNSDAQGYAIPLSGSYRPKYNDHYTNDGSGTQVHFASNTQIAVDHVYGDIYAISGSFLKKITPDGTMTTLAGQTSDQSTSQVDGFGTNAILFAPSDLCVDPVNGYVYIATSDPNFGTTTKSGIRRYNINTGYLDTLIGGSSFGVWVPAIAINENTYTTLYYISGSTIVSIDVGTLTKTTLVSSHVRQSAASLKYTNRLVTGQEHLIFQYTSDQGLATYSFTSSSVNSDFFDTGITPPYILDDYTATQITYWPGSPMSITPGSISSGVSLSNLQVFSGCLDIFPYHLVDPFDFYPTVQPNCNGVVAMAMIKSGTFVAISDLLTTYFNSAPTSAPFLWVQNDDGSNYQLAWRPTKFEGITSFTLSYTVNGGSPNTIQVGSNTTYTFAYTSGSHYNISVSGSNIFGSTPQSNTVPQPNMVTTTTTTTSTTTTTTTTPTTTTSTTTTTTTSTPTTSTTTTTPTTSTSTTSTTTTPTTSTTTSTPTTSTLTTTTGGSTTSSTTGSSNPNGSITLSYPPDQNGYYLTTEQGSVNVTVTYNTDADFSKVVLTDGGSHIYNLSSNPLQNVGIHVPLAKVNHIVTWQVCLVVTIDNVDQSFCTTSFGINAAPKIFRRVFKITPQYQLSRSKLFVLPINETDGDNVSITSMIPQFGTISISAGANFTYTAPKFFNGTDRINYTVCDQYNACVTSWTNVNVFNIAPNCSLDPSWQIPKSQITTLWTLSKLRCNTTFHDKYHFFSEVTSFDGKADFNVMGSAGANSTIVMSLNPNRSGVVSFNFTVATLGGEYYYFNFSVIVVNHLPTVSPYSISWNHLTAPSIPSLNILSTSSDSDGDALVLNSFQLSRGATPSTVKQLDTLQICYITPSIILQGYPNGTLELYTAVKSGSTYVVGDPLAVKSFKGSLSLQFSVGDGDEDQSGNLYSWSTATLTAQ